MPDLSAFYHVNDVVILAPNIFKLLFYGTIVDADKRFPATELAENARVVFYGSVEVEHGAMKWQR